MKTCIYIFLHIIYSKMRQQPCVHLCNEKYICGYADRAFVKVKVIIKVPTWQSKKLWCGSDCAGQNQHDDMGSTKCQCCHLEAELRYFINTAPMYLRPVRTVLISSLKTTSSMSVAVGPFKVPGGIMSPLHCKKRHSRRER